MALHTGMRVGELLGLRWDDLDLGRKELRVRQCLSTIKGRHHVHEPKTDSAKRIITLDAGTVAALRAHHAHQTGQRLKAGTSWQDHGLVFTSDVGTPVDINNLTKRFHALVRAAGVRRMGCATPTPPC